jgi:hypothetical protein
MNIFPQKGKIFFKKNFLAAKNDLKNVLVNGNIALHLERNGC